MNDKLEDQFSKSLLDAARKVLTTEKLEESSKYDTKRREWAYNTGLGPQSLRNPDFNKRTKDAATSKSLEQAIRDIESKPKKKVDEVTDPFTATAMIAAGVGGGVVVGGIVNSIRNALSKKKPRGVQLRTRRN